MGREDAFSPVPLLLVQLTLQPFEPSALPAPLASWLPPWPIWLFLLLAPSAILQRRFSFASFVMGIMLFGFLPRMRWIALGM